MKRNENVKYIFDCLDQRGNQNWKYVLSMISVEQRLTQLDVLGSDMLPFKCGSMG